MSTPALYLGATILFWGWQTGHWPVAVALTLALEGARATSRRWDFSVSDYTRAADLCTVIVVAAGVVLYVVFGNPAAIKLWFQWLAVMLLPLALMQAYGSAGDIEAGRETAIDDVVGSVIERGRMTDTPTPHLQTVYTLVKLLGTSVHWASPAPRAVA